MDEVIAKIEPIIFPIGKIIRKLMDTTQMTEADLCRGVNLPQTTINRLLACQTNDPRISTLVAIAKFFEVTIEQLLGTEPMVIYQNYKMTRGLVLPILRWEQIHLWVSTHNVTALSDTVQWVKTEKNLNAGAFAVHTPSSTAEFFRGRPLLLINPYISSYAFEDQGQDDETQQAFDRINLQSTQPSGFDNSGIRDGQIVLVDLGQTTFGLRQIIKEGSEVFLKRLFPPYEVKSLDAQQCIRGYGVEIRKSLDHDVDVS